MSSATVQKLRKQANNVSNISSSCKRKGLPLASIIPLTHGQDVAFDAYKDDYNLFLKGTAGTGKTFIATYLALREVFGGRSAHNRVIFIRSAVPTRDIGALPGDLEEKTAIYELPFHSICHELTDNKNAYQSFKAEGSVSFVPTSYIRGVTFRNYIIIVDEFQNMSYHELCSIITRAGENCRFIFCGDHKQSDLLRERERDEFWKFLDVIQRMPSFKVVDFFKDDIVRSDLVKEFIIAEEGVGGYF